MINKSQLIKELNLIPFGQKGFYSNKNLHCPNCGKSGKFGIKPSGNGGGVHCFKCGYKNNIFSYLKYIGKDELIQGNYVFSIKDTIKSPFKIEEQKELPEKKLPLGYKRILHDDYLDTRKFDKRHYDLFEVGVTNLEPKAKGHLVFLFRNNGKLIAWLSRSKKDKKWHEKNLQEFKEGKARLKLRYNNSPDTEFEKILGGFNEITIHTTTAIITEGLFDKTGVDVELNLLDNEKIKCLFTFGNKISNSQIELLRQTNIKNIYLLYDYGTINQSQKEALKLGKYFKTRVCEILYKEADPEDLTQDQLLKILNNGVDPINYFLNRI